jgi:ABC-type branched-subunit amino acid transport system permease subunit
MADETRQQPAVPERPDARDRPQIGVDTWVAEAEMRRQRAGGLRRAWERVPPSGRLAVFIAVAAATPFVMTDSGNLYRYGLFTLLYALLALGLNVVVGFAGLLDLGYVAFFGFGAYAYALVSSPQYDIHWPALASIPAVVAASALLGLLLGLPSRRLLGDYLAIVTLFFGQAFVVFVNTTNPKGLTGGPNGLTNVDSLDFRFFELSQASTRAYYLFTLIAFVIVVAGLHFLSESRIGRAWKALREDPLAAELMGMPVNRLKLLAFMFGAAVAGLTGTIFAAAQQGVFPGDFDVSLLITIYAVVILGGLGSLAGVVIGAIVINVSFEVLTPATPDHARWLFYGVVLALLLTRLRPWPKLAVVLGGTALFGFGLHAIVAATWPSGTRGAVESGGFLTDAIKAWVVVPANPGRLGSYAYVALIAAVLVLTRLQGWWRIGALVPTLYLVAFVWENVLIEQPAVTRFILFGALLVALMAARPQGLLGTTRVEIV